MFFNFLALQISSLNALAKSKVELGKALIRAAEKANKGDDKAKEADSKGVETGKKRKKPASWASISFVRWSSPDDFSVLG